MARSQRVQPTLLGYRAVFNSSRATAVRVVPVLQRSASMTYRSTNNKDVKNA